MSELQIRLRRNALCLPLAFITSLHLEFRIAALMLELVALHHIKTTRKTAMALCGASLGLCVVLVCLLGRPQMADCDMNIYFVLAMFVLDNWDAFHEKDPKTKPNTSLHWQLRVLETAALGIADLFSAVFIAGCPRTIKFSVRMYILTHISVFILRWIINWIMGFYEKWFYDNVEPRYPGLRVRQSQKAAHQLYLSPSEPQTQLG